jgi:hypothetical protein
VYAQREENKQQLLAAASDDKSWPKARRFLFLIQLNRITLLLDKSLASMFWPSTKQLLFHTKNYSFLPDYLSLTQAHTIFGLHTVPNNYINLDNGLILYQCEKKLID